jgi:hypothetical protein
MKDIATISLLTLGIMTFFGNLMFICLEPKGSEMYVRGIAKMPYAIAIMATAIGLAAL